MSGSAKHTAEYRLAPRRELVPFKFSPFLSTIPSHLTLTPYRIYNGSVEQRKGSYFLLISQGKDATIQVGKLGEVRFSAGYYLYAGSALGGVDGRIHRHLRSDKKMHWHIDYLLAHSRIVEVWYALSAERLECLFAQAALALPQARMPARGFGSSDCRCPSHLVGLPVKPVRTDVEVELERVSGRRIPLAQLALPDVP